MPRPTRQQRLTEAEQRTRDKIDASKRTLLAIQAAQRALEKKARDRRRYQVGQLADDAGLLALDDAVLRPLFAVLHAMAGVPDPVAVLEAILQDVGGAPGRSVDACGHRGDGVSPLG